MTKLAQRLHQFIEQKIPYINPYYSLYIIFQLITYYIFSHSTVHFNLHWWTPQLKIDLYLPLVMPMVIPYVLYAPLVLAPIFLPIRKSREKLLALSLCLVSILNYIFAFTISPHVTARVPLFDQEQGILFEILNWIYNNDPNSLYFPSMHVMHSLLIGFYLWKPRSYRGLFLPCAIVIGASTIFVKQHFLLDALVGVVVAVFVYYFIPYVARDIFKAKWATSD